MSLCDLEAIRKWSDNSHQWKTHTLTHSAMLVRESSVVSDSFVLLLIRYGVAFRSLYSFRNVLLSLATRTVTFGSHCFPDSDFRLISDFLDTERHLVILGNEVKLA